MVSRIYLKIIGLALTVFIVGCQSKIETPQQTQATIAPSPEVVATPAPVATPSIPNLQTELLDNREKTTQSPIGSFDFKNYTYELPRGWQNPDGTTSITLVNGHIKPKEGTVSEDMDPDEKAEAKANRRIGLSYVTTKYFDVTGDGQDEAIVVLKIETGGGAIPQIIYIFTWKNGEPELVWTFRTGDRADGGLKDIRMENGLFVAELYGQDRFLLGQTETGKVGDDREQLCCPTYFTRSAYKWNGSAFILQGKRFTFSVADPNSPPVENLGEKANAPKPKK